MIHSVLRLSLTHFPVSDAELAHLISAVKADAAQCYLLQAQSPDADERQLVDRLRCGERAALEQLIADHQELVARLVSRLSGWSGETDDLVQEVFVAALRGARRFKGGSRLATWLTRIAINVCRSHHRKRLFRASFWKRWKESAAESNQVDASESARKNERVQQVTRAVRRLKRAYREVVVLHHLEGMEISDVAQAVGISRGAVEVRLHRARLMLKEILVDQLS